MIPTSTGRLSDQYWSRRGVVLVTHADQYCFDWWPVLVAFPPSQRLLLRIGIKVADEWQISLDYVRGSNIYVRGSLD